jgi:hypothetical protein
MTQPEQHTTSRYRMLSTQCPCGQVHTISIGDEAGQPSPMGSTPDARGTNFAVYLRSLNLLHRSDHG